MHGKRILLIPLLFLCAFPLAAQSPQRNPEDRAQFFHDINIGPNGTANVVQCFGCNVHIRGHVTGDVLTIGGSIYISGLVDGNALAIGGHIESQSGRRVARARRGRRRLRNANRRRQNRPRIRFDALRNRPGTISAYRARHRFSDRHKSRLRWPRLSAVARKTRQQHRLDDLESHQHGPGHRGRRALYRLGIRNSGRASGARGSSREHIARSDSGRARFGGRHRAGTSGRGSGIPRLQGGARDARGNFCAVDARSDSSARIFRFRDWVTVRARRRNRQRLRRTRRPVRRRASPSRCNSR